MLKISLYISQIFGGLWDSSGLGHGWCGAVLYENRLYLAHANLWLDHVLITESTPLDSVSDNELGSMWLQRSVFCMYLVDVI